MDDIKQKNRMLLNLSDKANRNYVKKVYKEVIEKRKPKDFPDFIVKVRSYDHDQKVREQNLDDAVLIGIERLRRFSGTRINNDRGIERREKSAFINYNLESANFVGQFALDGHYKRDYVAWEYSDNVEYLKRKKLLPKDTKDGTYAILLVFPVKKDYPYSIIERIGDAGMQVDQTGFHKYLSEKTFQSLNDAVFVHLLDQGQFVAMFNEHNYPIWKVDRINLDTPQQRFKFVRKYLCGLSQNDLAKQLMTASLERADQKKIDYWETSDNPFPPFMRGDQLDYCSEIFAKESRHLLGLELRDDIAQDNVKLRDIVLWIKDFIQTNPNDALFNSYPDFIWRIVNHTDNKQNKSSKVNAYKDAVRRYQIQDRIDQEQILEKDQITAQVLYFWFTFLEDMSETEIVGSLELVYDNDEDRSDVYDIWKTLRVQFPKVRITPKKLLKEGKLDLEDLWKTKVAEEKGIKPPF